VEIVQRWPSILFLDEGMVSADFIAPRFFSIRSQFTTQIVTQRKWRSNRVLMIAQGDGDSNIECQAAAVCVLLGFFRLGVLAFELGQSNIGRLVPEPHANDVH